MFDGRFGNSRLYKPTTKPAASNGKLVASQSRTVESLRRISFVGRLQEWGCPSLLRWTAAQLEPTQRRPRHDCAEMGLEDVGANHASLLHQKDSASHEHHQR